MLERSEQMLQMGSLMLKAAFLTSSNSLPRPHHAAVQPAAEASLVARRGGGDEVTAQALLSCVCSSPKGVLCFNPQSSVLNQSFIGCQVDNQAQRRGV